MNTAIPTCVPPEPEVAELEKSVDPTPTTCMSDEPGAEQSVGTTPPTCVSPEPDPAELEQSVGTAPTTCVPDEPELEVQRSLGPMQSWRSRSILGVVQLQHNLPYSHPLNRMIVPGAKFVLLKSVIAT